MLAGWLIGGLLLATYVVLHRRVETWLGRRGLGAQLVLTIVLAMGILVAHTTDDTVSLTGVLLGAGGGIALLRHYIGYRASAAPWKRGARFVLGAVVLLGLRMGLSAISLTGPESLQVGLRFARYAILGLWIGFGAPWLFNRLLPAEGDGGRPSR